MWASLLSDDTKSCCLCAASAHALQAGQAARNAISALTDVRNIQYAGEQIGAGGF